MPLFRHNADLHFFAHIPKCGGMSVEAYLAARFGNLAFINNQFYAIPKHNRWSATTPQHVDALSLSSMFPADWIKSSFAVVRHPLDRLISAYNFRTTLTKSIAPGLTIEKWFDDYLSRRKATPFMHDNHLTSQAAIIPENATIFKLEDGLDAVIPYLDDLAGDKNGPRVIAHHNKSPTVSPKEYDANQVTSAFCDLVYETYEDDFVKFDYPKLSQSKKPVFSPISPPTQSLGRAASEKAIQ